MPSSLQSVIESLTVALWFVGLVLLLGFLVAALLVYFQRSFIYFPPRDAPDRSIDPPSPFVSLLVRDADRGVDTFAWYAAPSDPSKATILWLHGNAGRIDDLLPAASALVEKGYGAVLVEYRGYGGNPGKPTEQGLVDDARTALVRFRAVAASEGHPQRPFVIVGHSLGSGVASHLAGERGVEGVVLVSPFLALTDMAEMRFPGPFVRAFMSDRFDNLASLASGDQPVLVIHGTEDPVVPFAQGRELSRRLGSRAVFVPLAGVDHWPFTPAALGEIASFVRWVSGEAVQGR